VGGEGGVGWKEDMSRLVLRLAYLTQLASLKKRQTAAYPSLGRQSTTKHLFAFTVFSSSCHNLRQAHLGKDLPLLGGLLDLLGVRDGQVIAHHLQVLGHARRELDPAVPVVLLGWGKEGK